MIYCPFADVIWLHIRSFGEWTSHLYQYFDKFRQQASELPPSGKVSSHDLHPRCLDPTKLESVLEGARMRESVVLLPRGTQTRDTCAFLDVGRELENLMEEGELNKHYCQDYTSLIIAKNPLTVSLAYEYLSLRQSK